MDHFTPSVFELEKSQRSCRKNIGLLLPFGALSSLVFSPPFCIVYREAVDELIFFQLQQLAVFGSCQNADVECVDFLSFFSVLIRCLFSLVLTSKMSLSNHLAGIFPIVSYLHVPSKMQKPAWLMLGTCFLITPPTERLRNKAPLIFLTSAHTFLPWQFMPEKDSAELKIPVEFRKPRFTVGRVFLADELGSACPGQRFPISLMAVHPTLDVALLTMSSVDGDAFATQASTRGLLERFELCEEDPPVGAQLCVTGYRGRGLLGEVDSTTHSSVSGMTKEQQEVLMREMASVEGKQDATSSGLVVAARGVGVYTHALCYSGMSGSPVLPTTGRDRRCVGVLYGKAPQRDQSGVAIAGVGYIPSSAVLEWCRASEAAS